MRFVALLFIVLCSISCSAPTAPYFKSISVVEVQDLKLNNVTLTTNLLYHNPNLVGATVTRSETKVTVNHIEVGEVIQDQSIEVSSKSDFTLPVTISFPPKKIFKNKGLLKSALQILSNEKANVHYKGSLTIKVAGVEFDLPIDHEEEVEIK
jgi:LEA14-like dessication related protein